MRPKMFRLDPAGVYDDGSLVIGLRLTYATLAKARRTGELRFTRKGKRVLYRGEWLIEWLEHRPSPSEGAPR